MPPPEDHALERATESAFEREARRRGAWAPKGRLLGVAGFPDRLVFAPGGRFALAELKRPGERPRPLQRLVIRRLRRLGFRVAVVDSPAGAAAFFREWLGDA